MVLLAVCGIAADGRLYVNDKKAPDNRKDLEVIESVQENVLPQAHVASGVTKKVKVILEDGTKLKAETLGLVADKDAAMLRMPGICVWREAPEPAVGRGIGGWHEH